ncbi:MAG: hypothetical protein BJ554DRAFT_706 [Olpidium bornovanus]|uniref:VWFA domain-containing protein n=1 Tax=Olpidium bornovanus TaxID=278681 RepID=A0A8H8DHX8_9FUNG|nr:MAG: hypothetical protein BJ554DRAFT_706 [Olpidium bornovanus]
MEIEEPDRGPNDRSDGDEGSEGELGQAEGGDLPDESASEDEADGDLGASATEALEDDSKADEKEDADREDGHADRTELDVAGEMQPENAAPNAAQHDGEPSTNAPFGAQGKQGSLSNQLPLSSGQDEADEEAAEAGADGLEGGRKEHRPTQTAKQERENLPNPHRSLAEALQRWRKRLNAMDAAEQNVDDEGDGDRAEKMDESVDFEYLQNDQAADDAATLGAADEKQMNERRQNAAQDNECCDEGHEGPQDSVDDMETDELKPNGADPSIETTCASRLPEVEPPAVNSLRAEANQPHLGEENADAETLAEGNARVGGVRPKSFSEKSSVGGGEARDVLPLEPEESEQMRRELESQLAAWRSSGRDASEARTLWQKYDALTHELAFHLCEQLRLILEPTQATKLRGDYRTGKRLNMKKVIPYIASGFRKDKIWLRRTKPSKRQYQVLIAVDDSKSMADLQSIQLAYETLALVAKAMAQLEVGQVGVASFGEHFRLVHPFDRPFTADAGADVLRQFTFSQQLTNVRDFMDTSLRVLERERRTRGGGGDLWQLELIISDGVCDDHDRLRALVRAAAEKRVMVVFIIVDNRDERSSIVELRDVSYKTVDGKVTLTMTNYLETFPFDFYVVLRDVHALPEVLADALRQYFALVSGQL